MEYPYKPVSLKGNQPWIHFGRTGAEAEAPMLWPPDANSWLWKRLWCWERLKAEGEEGDNGYNGWVASPIQWTWTQPNSGRCWGTGKPGVLQSLGLQRVRHDLVTEPHWFGNVCARNTCSLRVEPGPLFKGAPCPGTRHKPNKDSCLACEWEADIQGSVSGGQSLVRTQLLEQAENTGYKAGSGHVLSTSEI